jgi:hypothetical protein
MTSDRDPPASPPEPASPLPAGGARRPPRTIELTAEDAAAAAPGPGRRARWMPALALIGAAMAGAFVALGLFVAYLAASGGFAPRAPAPRLAQIEQQLRELSARPMPAAGNPKALDDVAARLARLEAAPPPPTTPSADFALAERVAALAGKVEAMGETVRVLERRSTEAADAARAAREHAASNAAAISELAGRLAGQGGDRAARLALAAAALERAVGRGEPFETEVALAKSLGADPAALAALTPFAARGLPPGAALARELSALLPALEPAARGAPREAGWLDKLAANAEKLVRVRRLDDVAGSEPTAILARVEAKAADADIAGALAELEALPAQMRAPAQDWIARGQARAAALEASRRLAAGSLAQLGK